MGALALRQCFLGDSGKPCVKVDVNKQARTAQPRDEKLESGIRERQDSLLAEMHHADRHKSMATLSNATNDPIYLTSINQRPRREIETGVSYRVVYC